MNVDQNHYSITILVVIAIQIMCIDNYKPSVLNVSNHERPCPANELFVVHT